MARAPGRCGIAGLLGRIAARLGIGGPGLVERARRAKAEQRHRDAALLYEAAARWHPRRARLLIQAGHMRKESGELAAAEAHYRAALKRLPNDAELALQLGHFLKLVGRIGEAEAHYARALRLKPDWEEARHEHARLRSEGWLGRAIASGMVAVPSADPVAAAEAAAAQVRAIGRLAPRLAPRSRDALVVLYSEEVEIRRLGRRESGFWGMRRTLRGVEAIRGFALSTVPIVEAQLVVNGVALHRRPIAGGHVLPHAAPDDPHRKYVFNIWFDFAGFAFGLHKIEVRLIRADGETRSFHDEVVIAEPVGERDHPGSDALVAIDRSDARSIETQVKERPSMVRPAARALFPDGVRSILVLRTDQLGDLVASIPALTRLRAIAPGARIVGLLTAANADLAATLDLFDEIVVVDFPDDPVERRRLMPLDAQEALRARLEPYRFDIALDLAQSDVSRDLLLLSGARFLYGVGGDFPYLSAEFQFNSHDRWSGLDIVPHSAKVLAMVEALGAALAETAPVIRRADLTRDRLATYGIAAGDRFAVLHMGARIAFSRWPHFAVLAELLLAESALKIVLMSEDPSLRAGMPPALLASDRVVWLDRRLPFDDFDAFISFATVVVGNDSGPKHLAALRGTNVVTLFTARINWQEWGQERIGTIISRRVPCQGCLIFHDAEECGQGFTCIADIRPREVLDAVLAYLDPVEKIPGARPIVTTSP